MRSHLNSLMAIALLLISVLIAKAQAQVEQEWVQFYNGPLDTFDFPTALAVDAQGSVFVTGYSKGLTLHYDYCTIKYDSAGNQLWVQRYDDPAGDQDYAKAIALDSLGDAYITGESEDGYITTIKYSSSGQELWVVRYRALLGCEAHALAVGQSGVYVGGASNSELHGTDFITIKYDFDGIQQWARGFDGSGHWDDALEALTLDNSGNVIVTGQSRNRENADGVQTIKYSADGDLIWEAFYPDPSWFGAWVWPVAVALDDSNNIYVAASALSDPWLYFFNFTTIKYNAAGEQQWAATYMDSVRITGGPASIAADMAGNIYVAGTNSDPASTNSDFVLLKYNSGGGLEWMQHYDGPAGGMDRARSLTLDDVGNIFLTGESQGDQGYGDYDIATLKYNPAGQPLWSVRYDCNQDAWGLSYGKTLAVDERKNVYVAASSHHDGFSEDYTTIKYSQPLAVEPSPNPLPHRFALLSAYPNPFNATTVLSYELPVPGYVRLTVWDTAGRIVATLINGWRAAGRHEVAFDGSGLVSGVYLCRLQAGDNIATIKLALLK